MTAKNLEPAEWQTILPYLDRALALDGEQRERWVADIETSEPALGVLLRELLAEHQVLDQGGFLSGLPFGAETLGKVLGSQRQEETWRDGFRAGLEVADYRLIREVGYGGSSTVWLAEGYARDLKREVALKLPLVHSSSSKLMVRFQRERDILAKLTHPNIARLYDAGVSASGQPYLAMEFVEGTALTKYCDSRSLTLPQRITLFVQVLEAVQYAHAQLVLHRDLKPSNILVTPQGRVALLDFGIAKVIAEEPNADYPLTEFGGRALTPDYASPEQIRGEPLGTTSDIFSLGVVLYELLTGKRPVQPRHPSRAALEEAVLTETPPRLSEVGFTEEAANTRGVSSRTLARSLKGDLDTIVLKALQKNPADRYLSAGDFAQDLLNHLTLRPVRARPEHLWYRTGRFISRYRVPMAAGAVATLALLVGSTLALWQARAASQERDRAVVLARRNYSVSQFLSGLITDASDANGPVSISKMIELSEHWVANNFRGDADGRAAILATVGMYYQNRNQMDKAQVVYQQALALTQHSKDTALRSTIVCGAYYVNASLNGDFTRAAHDLDMEIAQLGPNDARLDCLSTRFVVARILGDAPGALRYSLASLEQIRTDALEGSDDHAIMLGNVADAYYITGNLPLADRYFRLATETFRAAGREGSSEAHIARANWATLSLASGRPKQALAQYDETNRIERQHDPGTVRSGTELCNIGYVLRELGRFREAAADLSQGLAVSRDAGVTTQLHCLLELTLNAADSSDYTTATARLHEATDLLTKAGLPPDSPPAWALRIAEGNVELGTGRLAEAADSFAAGFKRKVDQSALLGHAQAKLLLGDAAAAAKDARAALDAAVSRQIGSDYSNHVGLARLMLARALQSLADPAGARREVTSAIEHLTHTVDPDHPALIQARKLLESLSTRKAPVDP